jgi:hypothetical protein
MSHLCIPNVCEIQRTNLRPRRPHENAPYFSRFLVPFPRLSVPFLPLLVLFCRLFATFCAFAET